MFFIPSFALRAGESLYWFCQRWMPTNILVRRVRGDDGLRWSIPLVLLGLFYAAAAIVCVLLVQHGASDWWNLGFLLGFWNAIKLVGNVLYATVLRPIMRAGGAFVHRAGSQRHPRSGF